MVRFAHAIVDEPGAGLFPFTPEGFLRGRKQMRRPGGAHNIGLAMDWR